MKKFIFLAVIGVILIKAYLIWQTAAVTAFTLR